MKEFYVLGFLFSADSKYVALIRKTKPEWQKGSLNGIGGKIERKDDSPLFAMIREFKEETGVEFLTWFEFAIMKNKNFEVYCYTAKGDLTNLKTTTEENIVIIEIAKLNEEFRVTNLDWLIPMALDADSISAQIFYP